MRKVNLLSEDRHTRLTQLDEAAMWLHREACLSRARSKPAEEREPQEMISPTDIAPKKEANE